MASQKAVFFMVWNEGIGVDRNCRSTKKHYARIRKQNELSSGGRRVQFRPKLIGVSFLVPFVLVARTKIQAKASFAKVGITRIFGFFLIRCCAPFLFGVFRSSGSEKGNPVKLAPNILPECFLAGKLRCFRKPSGLNAGKLDVHEQHVHNKEYLCPTCTVYYPCVHEFGPQRYKNLANSSAKTLS